MFLSFKRVFKASWQSIKRNWWLSLATVLVVFLSVLTFTGIRLFAYSINRTVAMLQDRVDISIYFNKDVPESEIFQVQTELEGVPQVKSVKYTSQDEALEFFKKNKVQSSDF